MTTHHDNRDGGVTRRKVLECMTWAGTGLLWTVAGGVPRSAGMIDQASAAGSWVSLGRYAFAAGKRASVELHDVTGNGMDVIWFDAVRWTPAP